MSSSIILQPIDIIRSVCRSFGRCLAACSNVRCLRPTISDWCKTCDDCKQTSSESQTRNIHCSYYVSTSLSPAVNVYGCWKVRLVHAPQFRLIIRNPQCDMKRLYRVYPIYLSYLVFLSIQKAYRRSTTQPLTRGWALDRVHNWRRPLNRLQ